MNETLSVACPYCGETIYVEPEPNDQRVEYIEDCPVCCRPILYSVKFSVNGSTVTASREQD